MDPTRVELPQEVHRRYLLGQLSQGEAEALEREYFADDELFERILAAETDLLDEYTRGELAEPEREAFEKRLLSSSSLRRRLETATAFQGSFGDRPAAGLDRAGGRSRWVPVLAAAAVLFVASGLWLAFELERTRGRLGRAEAEWARLQAENGGLSRELTAERERTRRAPRPIEAAPGMGSGQPGGAIGVPPASSPGGVVSFALLAGLLRDIQRSNDFAVPRSARAVLLEIPLVRAPGPLYRVRVEEPSGREVLVQESLRAVPRKAGSVVVIALARDALPAGDYILKVSRRRSGSEFEDAGDFAFRITYR